MESKELLFSNREKELRNKLEEMKDRHPDFYHKTVKALDWMNEVSNSLKSKQLVKNLKEPSESEDEFDEDELDKIEDITIDLLCTDFQDPCYPHSFSRKLVLEYVMRTLKECYLDITEENIKDSLELFFSDLNHFP